MSPNLRAAPSPSEAGRYAILAVAGDAWGTADDVEMGQSDVKEVDVSLGASATVSGTVTDQDGKPVVGASVDLTKVGAEDRGTGVTAEDGSFTAALMAGRGKYRPTVHPGAGP